MYITDEIMAIFAERKVKQQKDYGGEYPVRIPTHTIKRLLEVKFPRERFYCYDLRRILKQLEKEGKIFKCPHESRRGQAVWRLV
ncbi:hypothetical protein [Staphylococcus aureus]|uniref:hypothetical protein n=1 Tax=Staphylococcus aureus TaxID=1280 RepID=UPI002E1894E5|nr:hypothetical protein [Staphylococcus aureus]